MITVIMRGQGRGADRVADLTVALAVVDGVSARGAAGEVFESVCHGLFLWLAGSIMHPFSPRVHPLAHPDITLSHISPTDTTICPNDSPLFRIVAPFRMVEQIHPIPAVYWSDGLMVRPSPTTFKHTHSRSTYGVCLTLASARV